MAEKSKKVVVEITSAITWDGDVQTPGAKLTVEDRDAKKLLERGKAKIADVAVEEEGGDAGTKKAGTKKAGAKKADSGS